MIDLEKSSEELIQLGEQLAKAHASACEVDALDQPVTPRELIYQEDKVRLYRYNATNSVTSGPPLLLVYALVNRPYMLDLEADRSLIGALIERGIDVWLIDWGYPDASDQYITLDDYVFYYLDKAIDTVRNTCGREIVDLGGVCQGGVLSLCYAAANPHKLGRLVTLVTPTDFHAKDFLLSDLIRSVDIGLLAEAAGNIPGAFLNMTFLSLNPISLGMRKHLDMLDHIEDHARFLTYLKMERWINDCPDQAAAAFSEFVEIFFKRNGFVNDDICINDRPVSLKDLNLPILNILASKDHIVPPASARRLGELVDNRNYRELEVNAGHIGLFVSRSACNEVADGISEWLTRD